MWNGHVVIEEFLRGNSPITTWLTLFHGASLSTPGPQIRVMEEKNATTRNCSTFLNKGAVKRYPWKIENDCAELGGFTFSKNKKRA